MTPSETLPVRPAASPVPSPVEIPVPAATPRHEAARPAPPARSRVRRKIALGVVAVLALAGAAFWFVRSLRTVSTDDAYVNGHVTFVAPRVGGQVATVLVDDNNRVRKGDLLVRLDAVPYQVQVDIAEAAVAAAQADVVAARAQARAAAGQTRAARYNLEHAIEDVDNQVALLRSKVASLASQKATLDKARFEFNRTSALVGTGALSRQDTEAYQEAFLVAQAKVEEALQGVYQVRVSLGLPPRPEAGDDLTQVPPDLDQTFSSVKQSQMALVQAAAQFGVEASLNQLPRKMVAEFYERDPGHDIDRIFTVLVRDAPAVKQADAKLAQARRQLDQAKLNLSYCDVVAEIDGVVARRNVNPGNNVVAGQSVMAVRSLTDVWVDANFKETQLAKLRIGQAADVDVDMYGGRQRFRGRVSGFSIGTGSTLALLPPENATGNFVKVVQRLPVRIELADYDPDRAPLFAGLSVTASVRVAEEPAGRDAGKVLQPYAPTAAPATAPTTTSATAPTTSPGTQR